MTRFSLASAIIVCTRGGRQIASSQPPRVANNVICIVIIRSLRAIYRNCSAGSRHIQQRVSCDDNDTIKDWLVIREGLSSATTEEKYRCWCLLARVRCTETSIIIIIISSSSSSSSSSRFLMRYTWFSSFINVYWRRSGSATVRTLRLADNQIRTFWQSRVIPATRRDGSCGQDDQMT